MKVTVEIEWDHPEYKAWLCPENIESILGMCCKNTKFKVTEVSGSLVQLDELRGQINSYKETAEWLDHEYWYIVRELTKARKDLREMASRVEEPSIDEYLPAIMNMEDNAYSLLEYITSRNIQGPVPGMFLDYQRALRVAISNLRHKLYQGKNPNKFNNTIPESWGREKPEGPPNDLVEEASCLHVWQHQGSHHQGSGHSYSTYLCLKCGKTEDR